MHSQPESRRLFVVTNKLMLIGPLPPPNGGARISFQLFMDTFKRQGAPRFRHLDLPLRTKTRDGAIRDVAHFRTLIAVMKFLVRPGPFQDIWLFCSPGFGMTYGLLIVIMSKTRHRDVSIRFFGGHPYLRIRRFPEPYRKFVEKILGVTKNIVVETEVGRTEFPESLQRHLSVVPGYREPVDSGDIAGQSNNAVNREFNFYYAGLLSRDKGIDLLADAFDKARQRLARLGVEAKLHLFGAASNKSIESTIVREGIVNHGAVSHGELLAKIGEFNALVFPSVYRNEGHSGAIIEALMRAKPVICFDIAGPAEIVRHNVNGLVIEYENVRKLEDAIVKLAQDVDLYRELSDNALQGSRVFDVTVAVPKLVNAMSQ